MKYWKYKAYDAKAMPVEGVVSTTGDDFKEAMIIVARDGLEIYDIWGITYSQYVKAVKMQKRIGNMMSLETKIHNARAMRLKRRTRQGRADQPGLGAFLLWGPVYAVAWAWWKVTTKWYLVVIAVLFAMVLTLASRLVTVQVSY